MIPDNLLTDLENYMKCVEDGLKKGKFRYSADVEPLQHILKSAYKIWELFKAYPNINNKLFEDISFTFACGLCDGKIPIINNDAEFSYQMHQQSADHGEGVVKALKRIQITEAQVNDEGDLHESQKNSNDGTTHKLSILRLNGMNHCMICRRRFPDVRKIREHVDLHKGRLQKLLDESNDWIEVGKNENCNLCDLDFSNSVKSHIEGRKHKGKVEEAKELLNLLKMGKVRAENNWIEEDKMGHDYCNLCNVELPNNNLEIHIEGKKHKRRINYLTHK